MTAENDPKVEGQDSMDEDRRKFLAVCGKFAVVTPPTLTVLLSTSLNSTAVAKSGGGDGGSSSGRRDHGHRNGGRDFDFFVWLERLFGKFL